MAPRAGVESSPLKTLGLPSVSSSSSSSMATPPGSCTCCSESQLRRGPWTSEEDALLLRHMKLHGDRGNWRKVPKAAGLLRCGKSCRLRWLNYLRPDLKRGSFSEDEDALIIKLHSLLGNRWSLIAGRIPGRSDNEIKNYWNFHLGKRLLKLGINPKTHKPLTSSPMPLPAKSEGSSRRSSKFCHSLSFSSISSSLTDESATDFKSPISKTIRRSSSDNLLPGWSSCPVKSEDVKFANPAVPTPGDRDHLCQRRENSREEQDDHHLFGSSVTSPGALEEESSVSISDDHTMIGQHHVTSDRFHHDDRFQFATHEMELQNQMIMFGLDQVSSLQWLPPIVDDSELGSHALHLDNGIIFGSESFFVRNECS